MKNWTRFLFQNATMKVSKMNFSYKCLGDTLIQVSNSYRIKGVGTVVVGGIVRGKVKVGDRLLIIPGNIDF